MSENGVKPVTKERPPPQRRNCVPASALILIGRIP